jgi:hypothetical protein
MAFSEIVLTPAYSVATDGSSITITDNTGTYPESEGGFAESGSGTATRPALDEVYLYLMYRSSPFDVLTENIPSVALGPPADISLLDQNNEPAPDTVYQVVEIALLRNGDTFDEIWDALYALAIVEDDPWTYIVEYAQANGAVGQVAAVVAVNGTNCWYDSLRRYNNAQIAGDCDSTEYATKNALLQGVYSNAAVAQSLTILTESQADAYAATQDVLDELNAYCLREDCKCNC